MGAIFGNYGIRRLMDSNQRFFRGGLPTYLRIKNFQDNSSFADHGLQYVPPSGALVPTGTTDILIVPPPSVRLMNQRMVEAAVATGSALRAGARTVLVSHTFVLAQQNQDWYKNQLSQNPNYDPADPTLIWKLPCVVGIVTASLLLEIVDATHEDAYGMPMSWFLMCNSGELSYANRNM